jgi:hypothetical protein
MVNNENQNTQFTSKSNEIIEALEELVAAIDDDKCESCNYGKSLSPIIVEIERICRETTYSMNKRSRADLAHAILFRLVQKTTGLKVAVLKQITSYIMDSTAEECKLIVSALGGMLEVGKPHLLYGN